MNKVDSETGKFVDKAKAIHGNSYNYDKVVYKNNNTKVTLRCKEHGEFRITPYKHISSKQGCGACGYKRVSAKKFSNTKIFIEKAQTVHFDKYDYSKVVYRGNKQKVVIGCRIHGYFTQIPNTHLRGGGCAKCGSERAASSRKYTTEDFITLATNLHGGEYLYLNTKYVSSTTNVEIICRQHGSFHQSPNSHLKGRGCPTCKSSKSTFYTDKVLERRKDEFKDKISALYLIQIGDYYKLGIAKDLKKRVRELSKSSNMSVVILKVIVGDLYSCAKLEQTLLEKFKGDVIAFDKTFPGHTECRNLNSEDVDFIKQEMDLLSNPPPDYRKGIKCLIN